MGDFMADTAVVRQGDRFAARLSRDWEIWGPNGGYVAAIALRAAGAATSLARPASFSGHFLSVGEFDDVDIDVTMLRGAKRAESLRVSLSQKGRAVFEAIVWVVADGNGLEHSHGEMPQVPAPEELKSIEALVPAEDLKMRHRFWENLEARPVRFVPWAERQPGAPVWHEWYRYRPRACCDDVFADAARSLLLIDTMGWPAACQAHPPNSGFIAPSLDVNVHFHRLVPGSEWLLVDAVSPVAQHGLIAGHARVWSTDGQLLASGGEQMLCRPVPRDLAQRAPRDAKAEH